MSTTGAEDTDDWLATVMAPEPSAAPPRLSAADVLDPPGTPTDEQGAAGVDLDAALGGLAAPSAPGALDADAGARKALLALGAVVAVVAVAITAVLLWFSDDEPTATPASIVSAPTQPVGPPTSTQPPVPADAPIAFTASADCPAGSTSAQALAETATDSAWVCVRGGTDGQVLTIDLGKTYVLTAVSVTPGWVAKTTGGRDEWLQHRVVTRLQYLFTNGSERTLLTQDTANAHGPVVMPLDNVLASRVTIIVLQTSRPPADPLPSTTPGADPMLPGLSAATTVAPAPGEPGSDPVDATFAMSELKFIGHLPN